MVNIRGFKQTDWLAVWQIIEPVFHAGETYAFPTDITEAEAKKVWIEMPAATFVAINENSNILGTYYIKPNQPGLGAHVCNCGYIVADKAQSSGIASAMCEHSQKKAILMGFRAMQFNLVVSTNTGAIRLWQKLGFDIIGTLPQAFFYHGMGYVDAFVMYKLL